MTDTLPLGPAAVDAVRWPDVAALPARTPANRLRAAAARALALRAVAGYPMRLLLADGTVAGAGGPDAPALAVHRPEAFFRRIGTGALVGFGESYMAGEWDTDDLVGVLTVLAAHTADFVPAPLQRLRRLCVPRLPAEWHNTLENAPANIRHHYDLPSELFALFMDETMAYSSALFPTEPAPGSTTQAQLPAAQHRKIDRLLDLARVGPGTRLLETGVGWGELSLRAARRGAHVTAITLSPEQVTHVRRRVAGAGLTGRVHVELRDYRHVQGEYDAVVSVEMIEAVGLPRLPLYFAVLERVLAPGGRIALQTSSVAHDRMLATRDSHSFMRKYIFPGGALPSPTALQQAAARSGLRITGWTRLDAHYAETLRLWRERFTEHRPQIHALGLDETFCRLWTLYLAYSEAGFRAGYLHSLQMLITRNEPRPR
ncbi:cyclopropane-fatty-acyl-phospholipid synthase [Streptomyces niveiscabiei]|uniref:cyclopropane-fatty-acyl-phospholipid synthase family protein n=1 Tax=Streptomyces niveiscabiei TaxID=164115 RepID=UPI0029B04052|nr:cyclopropane-fatty-acyl-phospholipid synthase family protein [Streptomyces niveiscabiei]MDX3386041.1 cyclopropane-fatty-acyl-phospholipid synthase [Streptomyces niveiscabiei]